MNQPLITIVDYGMGNIHSIQTALNYLGLAHTISADPHQIRRAHQLLLPGVGSFRQAMINLQQRQLDQAITQNIRNGKSAILGICLGMQLLAQRSLEDGDTQGLGLIPGIVQRLSTQQSIKIPHVGFNQVQGPADMSLFTHLPHHFDAYFVHSFALALNESPPLAHLAMTHYGEPFIAAYQHNNIFATQFHPEKSQANGLTILLNYAQLTAPKKDHSLSSADA